MNKRTLFTVSILVITLIQANLYPATVDKTGFIPITDYTILKEFYSPRDDGSSNEKKLIKYINDFSTFNNLQCTVTAINNKDDIITRSSNVEIFIKGSGKEQDQLILVCPLNSPIIDQQYHDNSLSIHILLQLALRCSQITLTKDVIFLFSGANENMRNEKKGIDYFIANSDNLSNALVTVIDIISNGADIQFTGSTSHKPISLILLKTYKRLSRAMLFLKFDTTELSSSRLHMWNADNFVTRFTDNGVTAVEFSNRSNSETPLFVTEQDKSEELIEMFYNWLLAFDKIPLPMEEDRHFQYISFGTFYLFISEHIQVLFFLILILLTIITRFFFPQFQRFHMGLFLKIIPFFMLLLAIFFVSSFIPTLVMMLFGLITGIRNFHFRFPLLYLFNAFLIPQLMLFILYELLNRIKFPKHNYLYMYGAIILAFLNLIIISFIDISYSYLYIWLIFVLTLSQFTGKRFKIKFFLYALAPLPFYKQLVDLTLFGSLSIFNQGNPVMLNALMTWFAFPFVLLNIRIHIIYRNRFRIYFSKISYFLIICTTIIISMLLLFIISFNRSHEQEIIQANCRVDNRTQISRIILDAANPIGPVTLISDTDSTTIDVKKSTANIQLEKLLPSPYTITAYREQQPDYLDYFMTINSTKTIEYVEIVMTTEPAFYPLESNYGWEQVPEEDAPENRSQFLFKFPRLPGDKIHFKVSLFPGIKHTFTVKLYYPVIPGIQIIPEKSNLSVHNYSLFIEERQIK